MGRWAPRGRTESLISFILALAVAISRLGTDGVRRVSLKGFGPTPAGVDMSTALQRDERLGLFREVTGVEDDAVAVYMLNKHSWDVQAAVQEFLNAGGSIELPSMGSGGQSTSPIPQPVPPANNGRQSGNPLHRRSVSPAVEGAEHGSPGGAGQGEEDEPNNEREALLGTGRHAHGAGQAAPAPGGQRQASALENVLTLPFKALGMALRVALMPLRLLTRPDPSALNPTHAARSFADSFDKNYGRRRPAFVAGSFQSAVAQAMREGRFLVVYLHSPMHQDTPAFCQRTLTAETLVTFLDGNVVVWGGSITHSDAYGTATLLEAAAFPFLALLSCQQRSIEVLERMDGMLNEEQVLQRVSGAMARHQDVLERQQAAVRERDERARLQEEQNREYMEALEADRRREASARAEADKRLAMENEARSRALQEQQRAQAEKAQREDLLRTQRARIPPEPPSSAPALKLRLQFPTGAKVDRRFSPADPVQVLRDYIDVYVADSGLTGPINYSLSANFPKRSLGDAASTLQDAALHSADTIYITDLDA